MHSINWEKMSNLFSNWFVGLLKQSEAINIFCIFTVNNNNSEGAEQCCTTMLKNVLFVCELVVNYSRINRITFFFVQTTCLCCYFFRLSVEVASYVFFTNTRVVSVGFKCSAFFHWKPWTYSLLIDPILFMSEEGRISTRENMEGLAWGPSTGQKYYYWQVKTSLRL